MAALLKHKFISPKGDGPDTTLIRPSNWNADHDFTMDGGNVVGRKTAGAGPIEQLPAGAFGLKILASADQGAASTLTGAIPTGGIMISLFDWSIAGWVRANGGTMSDLTGIGSEYHADDSWPLWNLLYIAFTDTQCPVSGGRSGVAINDFNAHKTIRLPNLSGRQPICVDNFGFGAQNVVPGATRGLYGGAQLKTIAKVNLPNVQLAITTDAGQGSHSHPYRLTTEHNVGTASGGQTIAEADTPVVGAENANTGAGGTHIHTGTTEAMGTGTGLDTMDPFFVVGMFLKL